jgi:hypothetical protein
MSELHANLIQQVNVGDSLPRTSVGTAATTANFMPG